MSDRAFHNFISLTRITDLRGVIPMGGCRSICQESNGVYKNKTNKMIELNSYEYAKYVHFSCDVVAYLRYNVNDVFKRLKCIDTLGPRQNGGPFANILKRLFLNEHFLILIKMSLKFIHEDPINMSALVQIMAWRKRGNKPLLEPMLAYFTDTYMRHSAAMSWDYGMSVYD